MHHHLAFKYNCTNKLHGCLWNTLRREYLSSFNHHQINIRKFLCRPLLLLTVSPKQSDLRSPLQWQSTLSYKYHLGLMNTLCTKNITSSLNHPALCEPRKEWLKSTSSHLFALLQNWGSLSSGSRYQIEHPEQFFVKVLKCLNAFWNDAGSLS